MRIEDFPRPGNDNGRGVHWSTRLYNTAVTPSLDYWIDQLLAMKIKWVKLLDDGGGSSMELCQKLLAADIMPIVRIYLIPANPNNLGGRELDTVSRLVDMGVRYFESNNEPDLKAEWKDGHKPSNWKDIVIDNFILDADRVLARGGLLALPAMGPGSKDNPVEIVVRRGRQDLFERGCWVAIHNYTLNHPLDYPDDDVNQQGKPISQEEFDSYAAWQYSQLTYDEILAQGVELSRDDYDKFNRWAWDGRNREMVNELRARNKNPGDTILDDPNCFRGWEAAGKMIHDALGFHVPVISTEGGPVVGWGDDQRYPKVNPTTHLQWQLDIVRFLQSQAPPWYFSCCTWLLASRPLGDFNPTWDQMSWHTHVWDLQFGLSGELPIVQALKDEPSVLRPELARGGGAIHGKAVRADGQPVAGIRLHLLGEGREIFATTAEDGAFRFEGLAAGTYEIRSQETILATGILLEEDAVAEVDLTLTSTAAAQSAITGLVVDTEGRPQRNMEITVGSGQEQVATVSTDSEGRYRLEGLAAGSYWVITGDGGAAVAGIGLDGWNSQTVNLTVPVPAGLRYVVSQQRLLGREETGNNRKFFGRVLDEDGQGLNGILVEMSWVGADPGSDFPRQTTPRDPFKGAGNYEFLYSPGEFILRVIQGDWPSDEATGLRTVDVPGREGDPISYEVDFQRRPVGGETGSGEIAGIIGNGAGLGLTLWLGARSWATVLPADGAYRFQDLPEGTYALDLETRGVVHEPPLAAGASTTFNYVVTKLEIVTGTIVGSLRTAEDGPAVGQELMAYRDDALVAQGQTDSAGQFRLADLQPGIYRLDVAGTGTVAAGIVVGADETVTLTLFLPPEKIGSSVSGLLAYSDGQQAAGLRVWVVSEAGEISAATSDESGGYVINELEAGIYDLFVEHPQLGQLLVQDRLALDGASDIEVHFDGLAPLTGLAKALATYVLFGSGEEDGLLLQLMMPHLRSNSLAAGFSLLEARDAATVIIVGGESAATTEEEESLRQAGCQVQRLPGDPFALAEVLDL